MYPFQKKYWQGMSQAMKPKIKQYPDGMHLYKKGDKHPTNGKLFWGYYWSTNGVSLTVPREQWMTPEKYAKSRQREKTYAKSPNKMKRQSERYVLDRENRIRASKEWQRNNPEKTEHNRLRSKYRQYGLTEETYTALVQSQNNQCAICHVDFKELERKRIHIDHCHDTGKVRGILCHQCNIMIGFSRNDVNILKKAIKYLK